MKTALTSELCGSEAFDMPSLLLEHFRAAARRNPRYSLRSFAKQLGIDHATLSQVLRRKRPLSARAMEAIGRKLGMSEEVIRAYRPRSGKKPMRDILPQNVRRIHLDLDTFQCSPSGITTASSSSYRSRDSREIPAGLPKYLESESMK